MRLEFKNQLRALPFVGPVIIFFFVMMYLFRFDTPSVLIILGGIALVFLPVAFLHMEYFLENRGKVIEIDNHAISVFENNERVLHYENSELEKIVFYKSKTIDTRSAHQFPTQYYFYVRFIPRGGKKDVVVTSLVTSEYLEEVYNRGVKLELKWSVFPSIRYPVVVRAESRPA
jgi:hypothetical protein